MDLLSLELASAIALSMGAAWASGLNLYAAVFTLGALGATGQLELPSSLEPVTHPAVLAAAGFMYCVEFFADKVPGVDTTWDTLHTFIRIPAGVVLAATAVGDVSFGAQVAAAIVGGTVTSGTHFAKAGTRAVANVSPEPVSNISLSLAEDAAVFGGLWLAVQHPYGFLALLVLFLAGVVWALPKLGAGLARLANDLRNRYRASKRVGSRVSAAGARAAASLPRARD